MQRTLQLLQTLGWTVNRDKCLFVPSQQVDLLGLHFYLLQAVVTPLESFTENVIHLCQTLTPGQSLSAWCISSIISWISHNVPFIHWGRLHLCFLQFWLNSQWKQVNQTWEFPLELVQEFLSHLHWFTHRRITQGFPLQNPEPDQFFFMDASLTGWGASWKDYHISGSWTTERRGFHINWLEMEAVTGGSPLGSHDSCLHSE